MTHHRVIAQSVACKVYALSFYLTIHRISSNTFVHCFLNSRDFIIFQCHMAKTSTLCEKAFPFLFLLIFFIWPSPPLFDDPIISFSKRNNNQQLISVHTLHPIYVDCFLLFQTTKPVKSWWQKHWLYSSEGDGLGQREIWKILSLKWRRSDGEWKWIYFYFKEYSCRKIVRMVE